MRGEEDEEGYDGEKEVGKEKKGEDGKCDEGNFVRGILAYMLHPMNEQLRKRYATVT